MKSNPSPIPRQTHGSSIWRVVLTLAAVVALVTTEYLIEPSAAQNLHLLAPTGVRPAQGAGTVEDSASPPPATSTAEPTATQDDAVAIRRSAAAY